MTNGHRRRVIIVLIAAGTLAAVDSVVRRMRPMLEAYTVVENERNSAVVTQGQMPDIVLLGSSRAKYGLVPDEFERATGRTAHNLSMSGSKVVEWLAFSRTIFQNAHPKLVVIGINASEVRQDYVPTEAARNFFSFTDLLESFTRDGPSTEVVGAYLRRTTAPLWASFAQRYELRMWGQEQLGAVLPKHAQHARELRDRVASKPPPKGYLHPWAQGRRLRSLEERLLENAAAIDAMSCPQFSPNAPALERLGQFLEELHGREIEAIVAYIPNCPRTEERWSNVEPLAIEAIASICNRHGVPFVPCPHDEVPRTNRDFLDEIHVGLPLAHAISRRAARAILVAGLLQFDTPLLATHEFEKAD